MVRCYREGFLTKICLSIVVLILLIPISNVRGEHDFDSAITLESDVIHEGIIDATDSYFKIEVPIGDIVEFQFNDLDDTMLQFCVYDGNQTSDQVDCFGDYTSSGSTTHFQKATRTDYFVKISCTECDGNVDDARFSLSATVHEDEAGDSIQTATRLNPESMAYGTIHGAESDFYATPVVNGDTIRIVINDDSGSMTSYRLFDNYGIKIAEDWENADYDFTVVAESDGNMSVELLCAFEGICEYSIIAIGSTYVEPATGNQITEGTLVGNYSTSIVVVIGLLIITGLILRNRNNALSPNKSSAQNAPVNNEIQFSHQAVVVEHEKMQVQDELEKAKPTTVVQNITYNIQDSAIAGDINATGLKEKDD